MAQPNAADVTCEGRILIYTDGACKRPRLARLRRAGAGLFYGVGNPSNLALPLPGGAQTNQRAELWACVLAAEGDPGRRLHVKSDSMYVVSGYRRWPQWRHTGWPGANCDLWQRLHQALEQDPDRIVISKVKGHAKWGHVQRGIVTLEDKVANAYADTLAGLGADQHAAMIAFEERAQERLQISLRRQHLMLAVLEARHIDFTDILEVQRQGH